MSRWRVGALQGACRALAAFAAGLAMAWPALAQPLTFLGDRDLAPFEFVVSGVPRGANVDLVQAIGRLTGRKVEVQLVDWADAQARLQAGDGDVLTFFAPTRERERTHAFTQSTFTVHFALFVRDRDRRDFESQPLAQVLQGRRIGVTKAGFPRAYLEPRFPQAQIVLVDNLLDGTRRLNNGDIDAFGAPQWSEEFLLSELGIRGISALPPFAENAGAMAVRKDRTALRDEIDRALTQLKASGELDAIRQRWSTTRVQLVSERTMLMFAGAGGVAVTALALLSLGLAWSRRQRARLEREVDERRKVEAALLDTQGALRIADERKDRFIAMLGHELRNPLAPISTAVHMLSRKGADSKEGQWALEVIRRQVKLMVRLIDDLLDVGRITSGKLALQRQPVLLRDAIDDALHGSRPLIEARKHELAVAVSEQDLWIDVDRARLTQIVTNLLNNAAKYTPEGGHVELAAVLEGDDVVIRVRDDGIGIEPQRLGHLFEMFYQEQRAPGPHDGGLGIGLWLTRQLVELHGGAIAVQSAGTGQGSEFTVRLPGARCTAPDAAPAPAPEPTRRTVGGAIRALVADDNVDSAEAASRLLAALGCEVRTAHDGREAMRLADEFRPELAMIDIAMPHADGREVCRHLRRQDWGRRALVVAMSGWGSQGDKQSSREAGFDEHLVKPLDPERVASLVRHCQPGAPVA
jgi:signal transduction histidine kinase/CheY-like chemotaxis protein